MLVIPKMVTDQGSHIGSHTTVSLQCSNQFAEKLKPQYNFRRLRLFDSMLNFALCPCWSGQLCSNLAASKLALQHGA